MTEEQADNRQIGNIGPVEAYHILWQHQREENRLLSERTTIFLAASSILFLAFVMLFQVSLANAPWVKYLRVILPISGIFLTLVFHSLARGTLKRLEFLWHEQENIERREPSFTYMIGHNIAPQSDRTEYKNKNRKWCREDKEWKSIIEESCLEAFLGCLSKHASKRWIPLTFLILWLASLITVVLS